MRRIRQWLLATSVAVILTLSFASVASADPSDAGQPSPFSWPGDGSSSIMSSPSDPGNVGE